MTGHSAPPNPERILLVINLPWDARLGASRVFIELARQWRAVGHQVEHFSLTEAFGTGDAAGVRLAWRQALFTWKAARFVRRNAARFDIIDALVSALPATKRRLKFRGLLVARSVGLPRFYHEFDKSIPERWPRVRRGSIAGRLFYPIGRAWLLGAAKRSLKNADLINVPNSDEARWLRENGVADARLITQPYGLTDDQQHALTENAARARQRLEEQRVCFIGMWSSRKGAHDWPTILRGVRARLPNVRFRFLGTMVPPERVLSDLELQGDRSVEVVCDFEPANLPRLLADCTVGAFPSYVEGFGLAVLEQLASGLPTAAYNIPGPRDLLSKNLEQLLVTAGDVEAFTAALIRLLEAQSDRYAQLVNASCAAAAGFLWRDIAAATLIEYQRRAPRPACDGIVFLQPFGLASAGGGARILRALLQGAPMPWHSVCSSPHAPPKAPRETHLPTRPGWGRIEFTRLAFLPNLTTPLFARRFRRRLRHFCLATRARAIHAIPHWGTEFVSAQEIARDLGIPFFLQVHDDFEYSSRGHTKPEAGRKAMAAAWQQADLRFVIGKRLGDEYCRRYGTAPYHVVSDGLATIVAAPSHLTAGRLRVYFMGLFHLEYETNLRVLIEALRDLRAQRSDATISLTLRCGSVRAPIRDLAPDLLSIKPFGSEEDVQRDLAEADLLYLPLPFEGASAPLARFSVSTKMITYLGSGIPILYHGPAQSSVHDLLATHEAALCVTSLDASGLLMELDQLLREPVGAEQRVRNALDLARHSFRLEDQQEIFWGRINERLSPTEATSRPRPLVNA
ncbi:MAG: glycosyltransferase family 4 protein [Chthoniobacterales bacterium]